MNESSGPEMILLVVNGVPSGSHCPQKTKHLCPEPHHSWTFHVLPGVGVPYPVTFGPWLLELMATCLPQVALVWSCHHMALQSVHHVLPLASNLSTEPGLSIREFYFIL